MDQPHLSERLRAQWELHPDLYGSVAAVTMPYRFTTDPQAESALPRWIAPREPLLADEALVDLMHAATFLADPPADAWAARADDLGHRTVVELLRRACREGLESMPDAPEELITFVRTMEATPEWIDMDLVEQGAREARIPEAYLSPFIIRGVFLGTFTNTYSALPMALTGALTSRRAAHRVRETGAFFAATTLPGALGRTGVGFEAAAVVRLMHSLVRVAALTDGARWDASTYGMPIPQVDQMPAGMINLYVHARRAQRSGQDQYNPRERAVVELTRYRCFLLGLPRELLPTTPAEVIRLFHGRGATLREDFDHAICGQLIRSTVDAHVRLDDTSIGRVAESVERSWSKVAFCRAFCDGDRDRAAGMGVDVTTADRARVTLTSPFVLGRMALAVVIGGLPIVDRLVDRLTVRTMRRRLAAYGGVTDDERAVRSRPA